MKKISYKSAGVCCKELIFEVDENNIICSIDFIGGCPGNLLGLRSLVIGQSADSIAEKLEGITCGNKSTSCPDQLSKAIKESM